MAAIQVLRPSSWPRPAGLVSVVVALFTVAVVLAPHNPPLLLLVSCFEVLICAGLWLARSPVRAKLYVSAAVGSAAALVLVQSVAQPQVRELAVGILLVVVLEWSPTGSPLDGEGDHAPAWLIYAVLAAALVWSPSSWAVLAAAATSVVLLSGSWAIATLLLVVTVLVQLGLEQRADPIGLGGVFASSAPGLSSPWQKLGQVLCVAASLPRALTKQPTTVSGGAHRSIALACSVCAMLSLSGGAIVTSSVPLFGALVGHQLADGLGGPSMGAVDRGTGFGRYWLFSALLLATAVFMSQDVWLLVHAGAISLDEGYVAAFARAMLDGGALPYVDAVSHRGPLLYYATALAQWLGGSGSWTGLRILSTLCQVTTLVAVALVPLRLGRRLAAAMAALIFSILVGITMPPSAALSVSGESLGMAFLSLSLSCATRAMVQPRGRAVALIASGVLASLAALTKQTLLLAAIPFAGLAWAVSRRATARRQLMFAAWLVAYLSPVALIIVRYAVAERLHDLWYWTFRYNAEIYMSPYQGLSLRDIFRAWHQDEQDASLELLLIVTLFAFAGVTFVRHAVVVCGQRAAPRVEPLLTLAISALVILGCIGAAAPLRFWWHYFVAVTPWAALLLALTFDAQLGRHLSHQHTNHSWLAVAPLACFAAMGFISRLLHLEQQRQDGLWQRGYGDPICGVVRRFSKPSESLLVWGFDADLYVSCNRKPATKYVYSTMVMGVVPPFWYRQRTNWVAPGARIEAAHEVASQRPALILENRNRFHGMSLLSIPELRSQVKESYCAPLVAEGSARRLWQVYVRKDVGCERLRRDVALGDASRL